MKRKPVSSRELMILLLSEADCIECSRRVLHSSILPGKQVSCIQASPSSHSKGLPQLPLSMDIVLFGSFFCVWGILCPTCASSLRPLLASSFPSNILILSFFFFLFQGANIINSSGTWAELR